MKYRIVLGGDPEQLFRVLHVTPVFEAWTYANVFDAAISRVQANGETVGYVWYTAHLYGPEIHFWVQADHRGRWLSRRTLKDIFFTIPRLLGSDYIYGRPGSPEALRVVLGAGLKPTEDDPALYFRRIPPWH